LYVRYTKWHEMVVDTIALRRKMTKMIKRMQNGAIIGAFGRWVEMIEEKKKAKFMTGKAVRMMLNRVLVGLLQVDPAYPYLGR
jgi:hypothetical protein